MPDFFQHELITTIHDLRTGSLEKLESMLRVATEQSKIGLVLPVTAADMRAEPFDTIVRELEGADYLASIVVTLGVAPDVSDYEETCRKVAPLGDRCHVLWTDGPKVQSLFGELIGAGIPVSTPGKGRSVWAAFGYLLADPDIDVFVLHDCDIVDYDRFFARPALLADGTSGARLRVLQGLLRARHRSNAWTRRSFAGGSLAASTSSNLS